MMIGLVHPGTSRGTFLQMMGSRKMTPPRMLRIVPLGERYISLRLNSFTRASSGVMVAHLTTTPIFFTLIFAMRDEPLRARMCEGRRAECLRTSALGRGGPHPARPKHMRAELRARTRRAIVRGRWRLPRAGHGGWD